jgi:hypothetical protein
MADGKIQRPSSFGCRKWPKARIGGGDVTDFGLGPESVMEGGKVVKYKRGPKPPFFRFYGLRN